MCTRFGISTDTGVQLVLYESLHVVYLLPIYLHCLPAALRVLETLTQKAARLQKFAENNILLSHTLQLYILWSLTACRFENYKIPNTRNVLSALILSNNNQSRAKSLGN